MLNTYLIKLKNPKITSKLLQKVLGDLKTAGITRICPFRNEPTTCNELCGKLFPILNNDNDKDDYLLNCPCTHPDLETSYLIEVVTNLIEYNKPEPWSLRKFKEV